MLFHFDVYSYTSDLHLIKGSYLFVDFFFVLSGFVISANYLSRLHDSKDLYRFLFLRFGRLYPVHIVVLSAYVMFELTLYLVPPLGDLSPDGVFSSEANSPYAIFTNLLLIHSLGVHDSTTWNHSSWSISVEYYAYVLFAVLLLASQAKHILIISVALISTSIAIVYFCSDSMDVTVDYGIFRCVAGFFAGLLCYLAFSSIQSWNIACIGFLTATLVEVLAVCGAYFFVSSFSQHALSVLAPMVFSAVVLAFSYEGGALSAILRHRAFLFLGAISYSLYMTHQFLQARIMNAFLLANEYFRGLKSNEADFMSDQLWEIQRWHGDIAISGMLVAVVVTSYLTYTYVEVPFRERSRRLADKLGRAGQRAVATAR